MHSSPTALHCTQNKAIPLEFCCENQQFIHFTKYAPVACPSKGPQFIECADQVFRLFGSVFLLSRNPSLSFFSSFLGSLFPFYCLAPSLVVVQVRCSRFCEKQTIYGDKHRGAQPRAWLPNVNFKSLRLNSISISLPPPSFPFH